MKSCGAHLTELCRVARKNAAALKTLLYLGLSCVVMTMRLVVQRMWQGPEAGRRTTSGKKEGEELAKEERELSLLKAMSYVWSHLCEFLALSERRQHEKLIQYARYERRKNRKNMQQKMKECFA